MINTAAVLPLPVQSRYFGPATVVKTKVNEDLCLFGIQIAGQSDPLPARSALSNTATLRVNDEVLVAGEDPNHLYIIGVIRTASPSGHRPVKVEIDRGAHAIVKEKQLSVFSDQGELIFEYMPSKGRSRVWVESGSLKVDAPSGDLSLSSGSALCLQAEDVQIKGHSSVNIEVKKPNGFAGSAVSLQNQRLQMNAPELRAAAQRGHWHIQDTRYIGKTGIVCMGHLQLFTDKLETLAQSVVEKAKDIFRTVTHLYQVRAKRKRSSVETTYHVKAKDMFFKSDEDFKVRGDQIHLG